MSADTVPMDDLVEVAETVSPGDEVELATITHEYKAPLEVVEAKATEWICPVENWRTATIELVTNRGTAHEIVGVEGERIPSDRTSGNWHRVTRIEVPEVDGSEESDDEDLDPIEELDQKRRERNSVSSIAHLTLDDVLDAVEGASTVYEVTEELRIGRPTVRWLLRQLDLWEPFQENLINGSTRSELLDVVREKTELDVPEGDDSWQEIYGEGETA